MPLFETVALAIGPAIAKAIIKSWLNDGLPNTLAGNAVDLLKKKIEDALSQNKADHQIERIGAEVAERLLPVFRGDGIHVSEDQRYVAGFSLAQTLIEVPITARQLVGLNLDAGALERYLNLGREDVTRSMSEVEAALYGRLIKESAISIMKVATQLTGFEQSFSATTLQNQDEILAGIAKLLAIPTQEAERFETRYRLAVKDQLDRLDFFGMPEWERSTRRQSLTHVFVPLNVTVQIPRRDDSEGRVESRLRKGDQPEAGREADYERQTWSFEYLLTRSRRIVLLGQAGSGKSTHLQWLAVRTASRDLPVTLGSFNDSVPFFIRLRTCVSNGYPGLKELPNRIDATLEVPDGWVTDQFEALRAVVLIDGVDELPKERRDDLLNFLNDLTRNHPHALYIISSRPPALKADEWPAWQEWVTRQGFVTATLDAMTPTQMDTVIDRWHSALEQAFTSEWERQEIRALPGALKPLLRTRPPVRQLATNPLLCSMICALHRDRQEILPAGRVELYEKCIDMLLEIRDKGRKIDLRDYPDLKDRKYSLDLIQHLAYWMMRNNQSEVDFEKAVQIFDERLPYHDLSEVTGLGVARFFLERTNLLREPIPGRVDFHHKTFQEYLAALAVKRDHDFGFLHTQSRNDQWRETIIVAVGKADMKDRDDFLKQLIKRGDKLKTPRHRYQLRLLALACLESGPIRRELREQVVQKTAEAFPPHDDDDVRLIAIAGDQALPFLHPNAKHASDEVAHCVDTLALIGTERALQVIMEYAVDTRYEVKRALGLAWDNFDRENYVQQVFGRTTDIVLPQLPAAHELDQLVHVTSLSLDSAEGDLSLLQRLSNLAKLQISGGSENTLSLLEHLTNLVTLSIVDTQISDLGPLARMTGLKTLSISGGSAYYIRQLMQRAMASGPITAVSDLAPLAALTNLASLSVDNTQVSDLAPLAGSTNLTSLSFDNTQVSDLVPLAGLTNLTSLVVSDTQVSDLAPLAGLTNLTRLDVSDTQVSDLAPLARLTNLTSLVVGKTQVSDLAPLAGLTNLTRLDVSDTQVSDLAPLAGLTNLTSLNVSKTQVSDLAPLAGLTNLTSLNVNDTQVSDLAPLVGLTRLEGLFVYETQVSDLNPLAGLTNLITLYVFGAHVSDLKALESLTKLEYLVINEELKLDDRFLKAHEKLKIIRVPGDW